ncbi:MAG: pyruvate dehydrogenase complex dihydrolipoamide acetyltransferase [Alphaproteobacteria bacterium]
MTVQILMPALSPTMTEGNLAKWLKKEGDTVKSGDVLAEIETDKATMEVEAVDEGRIGKILIPAGSQGVAVNTPIAILLEEGEDESALASAGSAPAPAPAAAPAAAPAPAAVPAAAAPAPASAPAPAASGERVFASPLARRIAEQAGVDLKSVKGTGPHGRIVKADVEAAKAAGPAKAAAAPAVAQASTAAPAAAAPAPAAAPAKAEGVDAKALADKLGMAYTAVPNSGMRKTIAKRLGEVKRTVPDYFLTVDVEIDALMKVRAELNGRSDAYKLSVNDFIIRAVALALKKVPALNAAWTDEAMLQFQHADISVAVATPTGLITPIVKKAETKGLADISNEMKALAKKARDNALKPEEYQGGTISISNLGMMGIKQFQAIINPPQACILAVGASEQRPVVKDGALAIATVMSLTGTFDHRVADGAVGAEFLGAVKKLLEDPLSMLL